MISRPDRLRILGGSTWFLSWGTQVFHVYKTVYSPHGPAFGWCQIGTMNFYLSIYICRRFKTARDKYHELLNSLSMLDRSWTNIILDFVTKLFNNKDYNAIFIIVNKLSKMHHYISCTIDENEITIEKIIKLFIQHVWKLHELLTIMISNRDSQFIFLVWDTICRMIKIKAKLFIAFHSKTDEQSEIFNQKMKRYLRVYVNH
jgi:hypothetical protein